MRKFITLIAALLALSSCIENDIPYPVVEMDILNIEVEGAISKPNIDRANRKITVDIAENIDIRTESRNHTRRAARAGAYDDGFRIQIFGKGRRGMR